MGKKRICLGCHEELPSAHIIDGPLRFCNSDCENHFRKQLPPNVDAEFVKDILE